jgi:hypothetical protein
MTKSIRLGTLSLVVSALLVGCGSDSSSSDNSTVEATTDDTLTGYFIDAEVEGVGYESSSGLRGTTDEYGRFKYKSGDKIKLNIGKLILGEVEPTDSGLVTPETLANGDEELKTLLLRTLQSLDMDGDPSNGITIPDNLLENIETTSIVDKNESSLLELDSTLALELDHDYDGKIDTNETQAQAHYEHSIESWNSGDRPDRAEHGNRPEDAGNQNAEHNSNGSQEHGNRPEDAGSQNAEHNSSGSQEHGDNMIDVDSYPLSTLTPELKNSLAYMGNEERLAYDVYHNLYNYHIAESGIEIRQLKNISENSEITHVGIVQDIVRKYQLNPEDTTNVIDPVATRDIAFADMPSGQYDIPAIQGLYDMLYAKGVASQKDALEVGCMVEVTDINDLDRYITIAKESNATDVIDAFTVLRSGSYSHYWGFDKGLKNLGIADGCCSLGVIDGVDYCHSDYPQEEHNEENNSSNSHGQNNGNGQGHNH